ncbi:Phenoloxidase-activating factor 2-like 8 [Homarus americanus]|uniref:Phenoloxidase-activating factor 2-like 8 n=2 Tax=Homarus americanus TaxID=6706 RepID=A0A8J5T3M9_HOMAM|nr:Phenoloxidase-activating factor 2-like 8 [Homarus americanus]
MKFKSVLCVLLLAATTTLGDDDWEWGAESSRQAKDIFEDAPAPGIATFSVSVSPEEEPQISAVEELLIRKTLGANPLPLEPHTSYSFSVEAGDGGGEIVDGLVVAEGGDREGRFLGIGEKLCSYGIGINCDKKYPVPVKSSYGPPPPRPLAPLSSYGAPVPKPTYPNRKHGPPPPPKAPSYSSPFKGLLSVLEPFIPGSKPQFPPKVGQGALNPSYTAPNPNYAPLLPSYNPPANPTYIAPKPTYNVPRPAYTASPPQYVAPKPDYHAPKPYIVNNKPVHVAQKVDYAPPKPNYGAVFPSHDVPKVSYVEPKPAYANPIITYTAPAIKPTVIEQHTHSHTHIYQDQGGYQDDYQGQGTQQVFQRQDVKQDVSIGSTHEVNFAKSHGSIQDIQNSQHHSFRQESASASHSSPSIVPAIVVGQKFLPGRIETGFKPMPSVSQTLFRPLGPTYREDCQCVPNAFCSDLDVVARNAPGDIRELLDARNSKIAIYSNATDSLTSANETENEVSSERPGRRGRVLDLSVEAATEDVEEVTELTTEAETIEPVAEEDVTEAMTEPVTEAVTAEEEKEETRVRRDVDDTEDETVAPDPVSDRQGRQLTGFTPGLNGCGHNHVCCRRPVFKPHRKQYTCGRRNAAGLLGRVKTAQFAEGDSEFGEYPWQAAILRRDEGKIMYQCGATLIDDKHVLTVAHCLEGLHPSQMKVRLGEWDVSGESEFYTHLEVRAAGVYLHPEYYKGNLNNDIAVVRLEASIDFSVHPHITPVCLPDKFTDFTHQRCHATGWGKDAFGSEGKFSQVLKEVELPVMEDLQCEATLRQTRLGRGFKLHEGNLCAGGEAGRDTCKGDGGSPLVCEGSDGSVQLAGVVSWGLGCGRPGIPGVYVKVSHYLDWIRDITRA